MFEEVRDYILFFEDILGSIEKIELLGWSPDYTLDDWIKGLLTCYKILKPNQFVNA